MIETLNYITIARAAELTGLTAKAIRRKIEDGKWLDGREYRRGPDGHIFVSIRGFEQWVEKQGPGSMRVRQAFASRSASMESSTARPSL